MAITHFFLDVTSQNMHLTGVMKICKIPLRVWFRAIWYLTSQKYEANTLGLQCILGFGSYRTVWTWLHKFRHAMYDQDVIDSLVELMLMRST